MTDKHLDDAIDRAVREMMSVDADPGFRARVFARIERSPSRRWSWSRLAVVATATAAVAVAAFLARIPAPAPPAPRIEQVAHAPVAPGRPAMPPPAAPAGQDTARPQRPAAAVRQRRATQPAMPNVTQQVAAGAIVATVAEPEASADPGDAPGHAAAAFITPIRIPEIGPAAIVISPLAPLPELRIAPLTPRIERD